MSSTIYRRILYIYTLLETNGFSHLKIDGLEDEISCPFWEFSCLLLVLGGWKPPQHWGGQWIEANRKTLQEAGHLWEQALAVLESMTTFQLSLDVITFNATITSCANSTQKSMALQVLQRMLGLLIFDFRPLLLQKQVLSRLYEAMII